MHATRSEDHAQRIGRLCEEQAVAAAFLGSPFYESLLTAMAADARSDGPTARVFDEHTHLTDADAIPLRLLGTVHRMVLAGDAPTLAAHYPDVDGDGDASAAWPALRDLLADRPDDVRPGLDRPPQTNEVGRSVALLGGLLHVADRWALPVALHELGASAGLNLRPDRLAYRSAVGDWGDDRAPVTFEACWEGESPPVDAPVEIVVRAGCDVTPLDPATEDGRLRLLGYVWPDDERRLARLRGALDLAEREPVEVSAEPASAFLARLEPTPGHALVVWHSVMWQYLDPAESDACRTELARLAAEATDVAPFAWLSFEPEEHADGPPRFVVRLRTWPGGDDLALGDGHPHGPPVRWAR